MAIEPKTLTTAVVILNWNGREMMKTFLPSVVRHSRYEARVIVADNGSADGSCEMLEQEFPEVEVIRLKRNFGFAEGYNRALAQVDADCFVLLNSDVEVTAHWLTPLIAAMNADEEIAALQPKLRSYHKPEEFEYAGAAGGFIDRYGYPYCRGRIFDTVETDEGQYDAKVPLLWATGAALMVRRSYWEAAGGLDGRFFAHMEEIDLCWRFRLMGKKIFCISDSIVYHVGGATLAQGNPRKTFLNFRNNLLMLYKNLPPRELKRVLFVRAILDYVAALQFLLKGSLGEAKAVLDARRAYSEMKKDYKSIREANMRRACQVDFPERSKFSILLAYHLKHQHRFSELSHS